MKGREILVYQIERGPTSKDEINGAFNVAVFEQVIASVIAKGVLESNEPAIVKGRLVP